MSCVSCQFRVIPLHLILFFFAVRSGTATATATGTATASALLLLHLCELERGGALEQLRVSCKACDSDDVHVRSTFGADKRARRRGTDEGHPMTCVT